MSEELLVEYRVLVEREDGDGRRMSVTVCGSEADAARALRRAHEDGCVWGEVRRFETTRGGDGKVRPWRSHGLSAECAVAPPAGLLERLRRVPKVNESEAR